MDGRGLLRAVKWFGSGRGPGGVRPVWPFAPGAGTSGTETPGAGEAGAGAGSAARGGERARVPGEVTGAESSAGGGVVRFARSELRVVVTAGGAVFCGWDGAAPGPSSALAGPPPQPDPRTSLEPDMDGGWRVVSERMTVAVSRTGAVEYRTPGGVVLRRDLPPRWWERDGADGGPARRAARWLVRSEIAPDARVFGLGGRSEGPRVRETPVVLGDAAPDGAAGGAVMPVHLVVADAGTHLAFHDTGWTAG